MKIKVTQEHIDNGLIDDCYDCPVAMAVMDALKAAGSPASCVRVHTGMGLAYVETKNRYLSLSWRHTEEIKDFIKDFDLEKDTAPFEAEITLKCKGKEWTPEEFCA